MTSRSHFPSSGLSLDGSLTPQVWESFGTVENPVQSAAQKSCQEDCQAEHEDYNRSESQVIPKVD